MNITKGGLIRITFMIAALFTIGLLSGFNADNSNTGVKTVNANTNIGFEKYIDNIYTKAGLQEAGLSKTAFEKAVIGYYNIKETKGKKLHQSVLSIIDFSKSSTEKRLWVIDLSRSVLLYHTLVAHGRNSGEQYASRFSNTNSSYMSSLGFYLTAETYNGKHGMSLALDGLEKGINNNARSRSLVVHAADYVSEDFIKKVGRLGRSQGCPAVPANLAPQIIHAIANGSCLFIYYPDQKYEKSSGMLNIQTAIASFSKTQPQKFALNEMQAKR